MGKSFSYTTKLSKVDENYEVSDTSPVEPNTHVRYNCKQTSTKYFLKLINSYNYVYMELDLFSLYSLRVFHLFYTDVELQLVAISNIK